MKRIKDPYYITKLKKGVVKEKLKYQGLSTLLRLRLIFRLPRYTLRDVVRLRNLVQVFEPRKRVNLRVKKKELMIELNYTGNRITRVVNRFSQVLVDRPPVNITANSRSITIRLKEMSLAVKPIFEMPEILELEWTMTAPRVQFLSHLLAQAGFKQIFVDK